MEYKILDKKKIFHNKILEIETVNLEVERYNGQKMRFERIAFEKRGVSAVLLEIEESSELVLVEQFRYSAANSGNCWVMEIVAGLIDKGENPEEAAIREAKEETGYLVQNLELISSFYPSVGVSNQVMHLFFAKVKQNQRIKDYQKGWDPEEDLKVCHYKKEKLLSLLQDNKIRDGKTIVALQWYFLKRLYN